MIRAYYLGGRQVGNKHVGWVTSICPYCHEVYHHTPDDKPACCGRYECLRKAFMTPDREGGRKLAVIRQEAENKEANDG